MIKGPGPLMIRVIGVGGAGSNAVDRMIQVGLNGVEFISTNTDAQALSQSEAPRRILLGPKAAKGLGVGGNPEWGARAAEESQGPISEALQGADVVFVAAGMGGGTGTGAAPVVARIARDQGALTIAAVTRPFSFEGTRRCAAAEKGIRSLSRYVDSLIVISNDRLLHLVGPEITFDVALRIADDVLRQGIQGISELITRPGLVNLDFASIRTVMERTGGALMAVGRGRGERKAIDAAQAALSSPLLNCQLINSAETVLVNITGGPDLTLYEVKEAAQMVSEASHPGADILFGAVIDPQMEGEIRVTLVAGGIDVGGEEAEPALRSRLGASALDVMPGEDRAAHLAELVPSMPRYAASAESLGNEEEPIPEPVPMPLAIADGAAQELSPVLLSTPVPSRPLPDSEMPVHAHKHRQEAKADDKGNGERPVLRFLANLDIPAFLRR